MSCIFACLPLTCSVQMAAWAVQRLHTSSTQRSRRNIPLPSTSTSAKCCIGGMVLCCYWCAAYGDQSTALSESPYFSFRERSSCSAALRCFGFSVTTSPPTSLRPPFAKQCVLVQSGVCLRPQSQARLKSGAAVPPALPQARLHALPQPQVLPDLGWTSDPSHLQACTLACN